MDQLSEGAKSLGSIRREGTGFRNERAEYLARINQAETHFPLPDRLRPLRHRINWPINMADSRIHISNYFGDPVKIVGSKDAEKNANSIVGLPHWGIDIQAPIGTPISVPQDAIVSLVDMHDANRGKADIFLWSREEQIMLHLAHLAAETIPDRFKGYTYMNAYDSSRTVKAGEVLGRIAKFSDYGLLAQYSIDPDVESHYGRTYDHLHVSAYQANENDIFGQFFLKNKIDPLLLFKRLYV